MSSRLHGVQLENTAGTSDKYYRAIEVAGWHLVTAYGPRGRVPGTTGTCDDWLGDVVGRKERGGYRRVVDLTWEATTPAAELDADPAAVVAEFDAAWQRAAADATAALAAAAADPGPATLLRLPQLMPRRGKVGGLRDARPWGRQLAAALQLSVEASHAWETWAVTGERVARWAVRECPGATAAALDAGDPAAVLASAVELASANPGWEFRRTVEVAAAVLT